MFSRPWFFLRQSLFSSVFGYFLQTFSCVSLSFLNWCMCLAVSSVVCPTKRRTSSPSSFLCILLVFPLCAGFPFPNLRLLLLFVPQLHLSGWKTSAASSSTISPPCLSSVRADGKCCISPFPSPTTPFLSYFSFLCSSVKNAQ